MWHGLLARESIQHPARLGGASRTFVFSKVKLIRRFLDGQFVGHAAEFGGIAKSLIVAPGHRKISISLAGYEIFNTEVDLAPNQKSVLNTDLMKSNSSQVEESK